MTNATRLGIALLLLAGLLFAAVPAQGAEPTCDGLPATIVGTAGDDVLNGTAGPDVIAGLGGDDVIKGRGSDDVLCGDDGNDRLVGGAGNDRLWGGDGKDTLSGGGGADVLLGEAGNDRVYGHSADDELDGGDGTDLLRGGSGVDTCRAGERTKECELTTEPPPPPPPPPADGDCSASTLAEVEACLADPAATDAATPFVIVLADLVLDRDEAIVIADKQNVTIGGTAADPSRISETIRRQGSNSQASRAYLRVRGGSNVRVQHLEFRDAAGSDLSARCRAGTHPTNPNRWEPAPCYAPLAIGDDARDVVVSDIDMRSHKALLVDLRVVDRFTMQNSLVAGATVYGIYFQSGYHQHGVYLIGNTIRDTGANGIYVANASSVTLRGNTLADNHRDMQFMTCGSNGQEACTGGQILVQDHRDGTVGGVLIEDNTITTSPNPPLPSAAGIEIGDARSGAITGVRVVRNHIEGQSRPAVIVHRGRGGHADITIDGNTLVDNAMALWNGLTISAFVTTSGTADVDIADNRLIRGSAPAVNGRFTTAQTSCVVPSGKSTCSIDVGWQFVDPPAGSDLRVTRDEAVVATGAREGSTTVQLEAGEMRTVALLLHPDDAAYPLAVVHLSAAE